MTEVILFCGGYVFGVVFCCAVDYFIVGKEM